MIPPASRQPRRSPDRLDPSRPSGIAPDEADEARLAPAEQARIDGSIVRVSRGRGGGPFIVAALVALAFLVGLVRPWDWLAGNAGAGVAPGGLSADGPAGTDSRGDPRAGGEPVNGGGGADGNGAEAGGTRPAPYQAPTCGYPTSWRTAAISFWAGARARIWTAAEAVAAAGPGDPSIPVHAIASDRVEAIGWCAPVSGPERPPLTATATLFRLRDGVVTEVPVDRLEPAGPDALGELWVPPAQTVGRRPPWAPGRYVIRLATPAGTYARYLGLEVGSAGAPSAAPAPSASGPAATEPAGS